ncbi:MAG TPA: DUF4331 domain-containing protein [Gaiellaceae bacterium]|nr:DUF4331 domain-containing protein [Gaiellaceae bacterium]
MRTLVFAMCGVALAAAVLVLRGPAPEAGKASSHREAPLIAEDPSADTTDLYAFRSPDAPDALTVIANWIPAEDPAAGPNWYRFSERARYLIKIDRNGDAKPDVTYRLRFTNREDSLFLGNTVQDYTVTRVTRGDEEVIARGVTPPNNIGPRSTPNYNQLAQNAVTPLRGGGKVFAGQREDAFFADIGAIFDLVAIRKGTGNMGGGKDFFAGYAVHGIALQIPIAQLDDADHVVGVWATTERPRLKIRQYRRNGVRRFHQERHWVQVSRLGNPLINEVVIPTTLKDRWNRLSPDSDAQFEQYYREPILAKVINQLYGLGVPETNRDDLVAVLLTGVPGLNFTGSKLADMLRVNLSVAPTATPNRLGVLGGDTAGFPNGRRLEDDVVDIAERAVAGKLKGHPAGDLLGDGVDGNDVTRLGSFPYENDPPSGFDNSKGQQKP